jgi:ABC-type transport system involved in cytochrome c biogenesis permease subunit
MMGKIATQPKVTSLAGPPVSPSPAAKPKGVGHYLYSPLEVLASLRLTVVLFVLSFVLVFAGTLAQIDQGIFTVVNSYFRTGLVWIPYQIFVQFGQVFFGVPKTAYVAGSFPYPGGWLLGGLLLANLLAAHAVRFRLTWKRSGILLLHSGLVILMLSELITGLFAIEGKMTLRDGESSNFVEQHDAIELAVVDTSDPKTDNVVVVPGGMVKKTGLIQHELLPFDVEAIRYMPNTYVPRPIDAVIDNPADKGNGTREMVPELPPASGTDPDAKGDIPSAYVKFRDKSTGGSLGTYLVSLWYSGASDLLPDKPQKVQVNNKTYDVWLRWKRIYKPYTIELRKFEHKTYIGTPTPKDFASEVRLLDPTQNEQRDVRIYMNNPLRYGGETFYQTGFLPGRNEGDPDRGTILQVVRNPGWLLPYISCAMVAVGMIVHFVILLINFLRRPGEGNVSKANTFVTGWWLANLIILLANYRRGPDVTAAAQKERWGVSWWVTLATLGAVASYLVLAMWPPSDPPNQFALSEFGKIPVVDRGRVKPMDTFARTSLMVINNRQEFRDQVWFTVGEEYLEKLKNDDIPAAVILKLGPLVGQRFPTEDAFVDALTPILSSQELSDYKHKLIARGRFDKGQTQSAVKWLLDAMVNNAIFKQDTAATHQVFRIENDQVLNSLGLNPKPMFWRYAILEIAGEYADEDPGRIVDLYERAENAKKKEPKERDPLEVKLLELFNGERLQLYAKFLVSVQKAQKKEAKDRDLFDVKILDLFDRLQLFRQIAHLRAPLTVPPASAGQEDWKPFIDSLIAAQRQDHEKGADNADVRSLGRLLLAYADNKPEQFNSELASYRQRLQERMPDEIQKADLEVFFNHFNPFYQCMILYVAVFLLACVGWMVFQRPLNRAAFWLALLTLVVHSWALITRMSLQGRPPVTNLYSAAVWISWGCVLLGLILEWLFRLGIGNVVAAVTGFTSMLLANHLAGSGDTLEMMQAVLDTNFWLATHVTVVTFGYVATVVAGAIGLMYVLFGVLTPWLTRDLSKVLGQMIYGVLCFATLLSFTGTVLGGIWADQSWGRFWGWDPKENGALLIVIWNALILHARWGGLVKTPGIAVLSIFGIIVTGWSGLGTNQLGVGLHAYGFDKTLAIILVWGWAVCAVVMLVGAVVPLKGWLSYAALNAPVSAKDRTGKGA